MIWLAINCLAKKAQLLTFAAAGASKMREFFKETYTKELNLKSFWNWTAKKRFHINRFSIYLLTHCITFTLIVWWYDKSIENRKFCSKHIEEILLFYLFVDGKGSDREKKRERECEYAGIFVSKMYQNLSRWKKQQFICFGPSCVIFLKAKIMSKRQ